MEKEIKNNILFFDGCNTVEIAKKYGTPLYVFSEKVIRRRIGEFKDFFTRKYPRFRIAYACKAFCTKWMIELCKDEDICVDVVSGGELYTALVAGMPPERIEFNGNNKSCEELTMAVEAGIGRIIADSFAELEMIENICRSLKKKTRILIRINPDICVETHQYMVTGSRNSKFGVEVDEEFYQKIGSLLNSQYISLKGLHIHLGSQILDNKPFTEGARFLSVVSEEIKSRFEFFVEEINLGGGFGAVYTDEERPSAAFYLKDAVEEISRSFDRVGIPLPVITIEPGRSIVAEAGVSLYTVGNIKKNGNGPEYVSVDGGMSDNLRVALYNASYDGLVCNKTMMPATKKVTICGKCCESGDVIIKDIFVPENIEKGDTFAVFSTGAYGYSMASNYNRNLIPAVVSVADGESRLIVKRQTYEELLKNDL